MYPSEINSGNRSTAVFGNLMIGEFFQNCRTEKRGQEPFLGLPGGRNVEPSLNLFITTSIQLSAP